MTYHSFAASNAPGTCKWCGRKLRRPTLNSKEAIVGSEGRIMRFVPIPLKYRVPQYDKPGDYGDGHFCGLRCGYNFGVAMANAGKFLKAPEVEIK